MQYFDWAHGIAGEALQRLLKPGRTDNGGAFALDVRLNYSESFRAELKQGFIDNPVAKKRLPKLVGLLGMEHVALALDLKDWKPEDLGLVELPMKEDQRDGLKISEASSSKSDIIASKHSINNEEKEGEANPASSESSASTVTGAKEVSKSSKKKRNKVKNKSSQISEASAAIDAEPSPIAWHLDPSMPKKAETKPSEAEFSEIESLNHQSNPTFETKTHSKVSKNKKKGKGKKIHPEHPVTSEHPAVLEPTDFLESADETQDAIFHHDKNNRFAALDGNFSDKKIVPDSTLQLGCKLPKEARKNQQQVKAREIGQNEVEITRESGKKSDQKPLEISRKSHSNKLSMPETNNSREHMVPGMATSSNLYPLKQAELTMSKPSKTMSTRRMEQVETLEIAKLAGGKKEFDQFVKPSGPSPVQSKLQKKEEQKEETHMIESSKAIQQKIAEGKQTTASASIRTSSPQEMTAWLTPRLKMLKKEDAEKQPKLLPVQPIDSIESLREVLTEKGYLESPPPPAITFGTIEPKVAPVKLTPQQAVEKLKTVLKLWTHLDQLRDPILLSFGSYLLGLHTADSDMDCIVLLPFEKTKADDWEILYREKFFGNKINPNSKVDEVVLCELNSRSRHCPNWSLYCMLCWDENVSELHKFNGRNKIPMITMKFHDFDFDLLFVTVPTTITNKLIADEWKSTHRPFEEAAMLRQLLTSLSFVDKMIGAFIDDWKNIHNVDARKGMLFALSGYRANLLIKGLLGQRSKETFKMAYLALKLWTKKHFIYGGKFGLLNGTTLTMMLLKVFLKHSDDSVTDILSHFIKTYSNWEWPEPVKLDEEISKRAIETSNYSSLDWKRENEEKAREHHFRIYEYLDEASDPFLAYHAKLIWPVILPGFPTQNAAFNVNAWTKQAIQRELERGVTQTDKLRRQIQAASSSEMIRQEWDQWLEGESFSQKYEHFVAIICAAESIERMRGFCDYVEIRIRLQLLFSFGDISKIVQWMHANPERVLTQKEGGCPPGEEAHLPAGNGNWFCTIWLVGVQIVQGKEQQNIEHALEEKLEKADFIERKVEKRSRREDFSHKIFKSFKRQESFTSSPRKNSSSLQHARSATSADSSATPNAASNIPQIVDITQLKEKIWTKYLTRETLKTWLPTDNDQ